MHIMVILILMTAAYQPTIARASDECEPWNNTPNAVPVGKQPVDTRIRIQCEKGYVRKAGTSNLLICKENNGNISWDNKPPLECIRDPKLPMTKTTTPTTERTEMKTTAFLGTSRPTTGTDTLKATNGYYTSTIVGVSSIIIICVAAAVFLFWWRLRHRERDSPEVSYIPVQLVHLNTDQLNQT
ncbi:interleukin-15 receptor subunit alpha isoform X4 [Pimephales promelas]|uniref:interleukin-15 receptor subunit alpha isoform X4 n=1 Tax=Pimephales promelas TaxID=90988 RepID=UPI001955C826|nr:interleukin-15 receptor subunit alpha isoform X4 [Pimephales promelas]